MGKFRSGILDGKNVSKISELKSIDLPGSNDISEKEELLPAFPSSSELKLASNFFTLSSPATSVIQCISCKSYLLFNMYILIVEM